MKSYMTVTDIAEMLKVEPITVRRWIQSGVLDAYKIGKEYRVDEDMLQTFLDSRKVKRGGNS